MTDERIQTEVADHVAVVTMNRPDKHNALDLGMFTGLAAAADQVARQPGVRAVILHGAGKSFCSGIDVAGLMAEQANGSSPFEPLEHGVPNMFQLAAYGWHQVPVPVIAAIHGNCLGGGLQIALGTDIRIATPDARLSVMEVKWGLVPDMAITRALPRLVPIDVAKELTFTGRIFDGTEAAALGVVTRTADDPLAAAHEMAAEIASKSPHAVRGAKRLYDEAWTVDAETSLTLEAELQLGLLGSPNQVAAVQAGMAKQPAEFVDP